jgi:hypothetical protein
MASKARPQDRTSSASSSDKQSKTSLAQRSNSDELDLDAYISEEDSVTQRAVAEQGAWVADTFYPGDETLATLRLRSGLSQKEFAALCGIRQPHISRYESGKHEPGLIQADRMARVLGVTLERLAQAVRRSTNKLAA